MRLWWIFLPFAFCLLSFIFYFLVYAFTGQLSIVLSIVS